MEVCSGWCGGVGMSIRRDTTNRLSLIRVCHTCGRSFPTTAATPFMRQMYNVDGKRQKTCYFCSEACKLASYPRPTGRFCVGEYGHRH